MSIVGVDDTVAKTYRLGTHRTVAPRDTVDRVRPLLSTFGITRVADLTGLDRTGVPVVMVCRPNARSSAVFHGKGIDIEAAKASGLMEAIETWHAEHVQLPLRFGSLAELGPTHRLVDVEGLARTPAYRFDPNLPMLWVEGRDLIGGEPVWLPFETVHADGRISGPQSSGCFAASTNGLASGNHFLEATSHALCEVIERDATSLWHRLSPAAQDRTRVDLATVRDDCCRMLVDRLLAANLDVAVWDITTDVSVPAFLSLVVDRTSEIRHVGQGAGCHPTREIALLRALTEAVQVRTTYIVGSREDLGYSDYRQTGLDARLRRAHAFMRPVDRMRDFDAIGQIAFESFEAEVSWLLSRLHTVGIHQAVAVDLTRSEYGVPVVRVVVPGLEGSDHHADYAPGARARAIEEHRP